MKYAIFWGGSLLACSALAWSHGSPFAAGVGLGAAIVVAAVEVINEWTERRR